MNLTFLWPTLAIVAVATVFLTAYNLRRLGRPDESGRKSFLGTTLGCSFQWIVIIATLWMGWKTAGIWGILGVIVALLVLPMVATFIIAAATGRLRRR